MSYTDAPAFHTPRRFSENLAFDSMAWDPIRDSPDNRSQADFIDHLHQQVPSSKVDVYWLCSRLRSGRYKSTIIDLSDQSPTREELDALSHALAGNKTVRTLRMSHCKLWSTDARILTYFLVRNTCLRTLDLSHNVITSSGCRAICEALTHNNTLKHLLLSANSIGNEGLLCLIALLEGEKPGVMKENNTKSFLKTGGAGSKKKKVNEGRTGPECGLQVVTIDENAIDDKQLIKRFKELCKQQNPGSVHYELKLVREEVNDSALVIEQLQKKIKAQAKELKLLKAAGSRAPGGLTPPHWGKVRNAVFGMSVHLGKESAKSSLRKRKKRLKRRLKKK